MVTSAMASSLTSAQFVEWESKTVSQMANPNLFRKKKIKRSYISFLRNKVMTNLKNSFIFCAFCHVVIFFLKNVCQVIIFTPSSLFIVLFWRFFVKEDWHGFFKNNIVQKFWAEPPIFICCFQGGRLFHLVLRNSSLDFEGLSKFFFGLWTKKQNKTKQDLLWSFIQCQSVWLATTLFFRMTMMPMD